ncbi:ROK family protein [Frondihabitans sp. Leaf304]|uniref:ROK family protein n=1 Tax=Frondihabitans sp. Leaf304 TaxID=1736329 RepID=UPI0006FBC914|nr:ROK family protein [Frondihabitans sp. Leaf304]KQQ25854.1 hypothetical protein ASF54_15930 [Frondihabitans sp. Leaf304]
MSEFALAVDIGGTKVESALVDSEGVLLPGSRDRRPTGHGSTSEDLATAVSEVVAHALAELPADAKVLGIGIGSAGPVDLPHGTVSPINLPAWREFPIRELVAGLVASSLGDDVPITLRLDGVSLALAEHWVGATQGVDNALAITVSTGVGGGLIVNGRLLSGGTGNAGHIGQVQIATRTPGETSESVTLEVLASGPHTVRWAQEQGFTGERGEDLAVGYAAGDAIAVSAVRRSATALGEAITAVTTLLDLDVVAIGGGFSRVSPDYLDLVRAVIDEAAYNSYATRIRVVKSGLSDESPLIGAAALVHQVHLLG